MKWTYRPGYLLNPLVDLAALAIITLGLYRLQGQQIPQYRDAKVLLLLTDAIFAVVVVMELVRNFYPADLYMNFYSTTLPMLIFADAVLLTSFSYVVHTRPPESRFVDRLKTFLTKRAIPHGIAIMGFAGYVICLDVYLAVSRAYTLANLRNLAGERQSGRYTQAAASS